MTVSIVIPAYNQYALLNQLLLDILQKCDPKDEIIIVDDHSTEASYLKGLEWWKKQLPQLVVIKPDENQGFLLSSNMGLKHASGDVKVLISTDVRVHGNLTAKIQDILKSKPKSLVGGTVYRHSTGWNNIQGKIYPYVEGYLLATTKEGWEEFGYFDEDYVPNDFEDVDLSTKAISLGYDLVQLPDILVNHMGGRSIGYNAERMALTEINMEKFKNKWVK